MEAAKGDITDPRTMAELASSHSTPLGMFRRLED